LARRSWIKLWINESLKGSIRFDLTPAERGVWYDLLLFAGDCREPGTISANSNTPYPHEYIANTLNIPLELLESTIKKCIETRRLEENSAGIHIVNWASYQSEYERQKPYREKKKQGPSDDPDKYIKGKYRHVVRR